MMSSYFVYLVNGYSSPFSPYDLMILCIVMKSDAGVRVCIQPQFEVGVFSLFVPDSTGCLSYGRRKDPLYHGMG